MGVANKVLDFAIFFILYQFLGVSPVIAHVAGFCVAFINSFALNSLWTFKALNKDQVFKQFVSFGVVSAVGLILSTLVVWFASQYLHPYIAKALATVLVMCWNYVGSWLFVFKGR